MSELVSLGQYVWRHALAFLFVVALCAAVTGGFFFRSNRDTAKMTVTLNYEEAALGLAPNGEKLDISSLRSREIMSRALELASITTMRPEELADCVSVSAGNTSGFSLGDRTSYIITTSYQVALKPNEALRNTLVTSQSMLLLIFKAYYEHFAEKYIDNGVVIDLVKLMDGEQEYMKKWELINMHAGQLRSYLSSRSNAAPSFVSQVTGESFASLRQQMDNLIDVQLKDCRAYLLEHGVARNRGTYIAKLDYMNDALARKRDKRKSSYDIRMHVIEEYDGEMISTVLIPTENSNRKFYMSKTETGIDYLAVDANYDAVSVSSFQKMIDNNRNIRIHMNSRVQNTEAERTKARQLLESASDTLDEILRVSLLTVDDYNQTEANDYLLWHINQNGPLYLIGGDRFLAMCAGYVVLMLFVSYSYMRRGKRNEKI